MLKKKLKKVLVMALLFVGAGGCSSTPSLVEFPDTANSADEVARLATDLQTARDAQVNVLAPDSYEKANEALKEAINQQTKGLDTKGILHSVAKGRAYLNQADQYAKLAKTNIEEVVAARQAAITAGAPKAFSEEFNQADEHLRELTSQIEENDLSDVATARAQLQKEYLDVELKAITESSLAPARKIVAQAENEGAAEYAGQSLAIVQKKLTDTDGFIVANRHQTEAIQARSAEATAAANHLLKITRASRAGENITSEEAALRMESEQIKTAAKGTQLSAEQAKTKGLIVATAGLKSEQTFNRSFEKARAEFKSGEAEVYRQGNQLVIRLRSLNFPTNQSSLRSRNFPLLGKVAKVIKEFNDPLVVVEGHTDSVGDMATNKRLSQERAQTVADYLISSKSITPEKVTALGRGFDEPLASNKTAMGKAQNRRVDVVISPQ